MTPNETRLIEAIEADMSVMAEVALELERLNQWRLTYDLFRRIREDADLIRAVKAEE